MSIQHLDKPLKSNRKPSSEKPARIPNLYCENTRKKEKEGKRKKKKRIFNSYKHILETRVNYFMIWSMRGLL